MRKWSMLSLVLVLSLALFAGSITITATAASETTLTVWGFVWTADWLDSVKAGFEETHPGITVNVERFEYEAYRDAIVTALAAGGGVPDVVTLDPMWAGDLIRDGALAPLEGIEEAINPADFVAGGWQLCGYAGKQYGVPADMDFNLIFYRKDVYDPAIEAAGLTGFPTSTEDFVRVAQAISTDDTKAILLAQSDYYGWYQGFLVPYGGRLVSEDGSEYVFNSPEAVAALQLYSALANKYGVAVLWDENVDGSPSLALTNGDALAVMYGSWYSTELASVAPEMAGQWGIAPMPWGPPDRKVHAATGGACFSVPTAAPSYDLAYEFVTYLEQPEVMATYFDIVGGVPALQTSWQFIDLDAVNEYFGMPLARLVADWSQNTVGMELPSTEVATQLGDAIYLVTEEGMDPQEALDAAVDASPPLK
jgi:ABC-type glycerol-3-phosphate transport system substrate-binding protein